MKSHVIRIVIVSIFAQLALAAAVSAQYGSISGVVTDAETGLPISGAQVAAINMDEMLSYETVTDADGYYSFDSLWLGYYIVGATYEGYEENIYPTLVELHDGDYLENIDIELTLAGPTGVGGISGHITDAQTGLPVADAGIDLNGVVGSCYTDASGNYLCDSIPVGTYEVSAYKLGYYPETYPTFVTIEIDQTTTGIDFVMTPYGDPGSISGTVTDAETGLPLSDIYVDALGDFGSGYTTTDAEGNYTISDLIPGDYLVSIWSTYYGEHEYPEPVTVASGQDTPGIDFAMFPIGPDDGIISGQILEEGTNDPVPLGLVMAYSENDNFGGAFTEPDGSYTIYGLAPDAYYIIAIIQGYVVELYDNVYSWEDATTVIPDASGIDFLLAPADSGSGGVTGVISSDGIPVADAAIFAVSDGKVKNSAQSLSDGSYSIDGLSPGTYTVTASMMSYHDCSYPLQLEVGPDMMAGIDIELIPMLACDPNGDGAVNIGDGVYIVNYVFKGGAAPNPLDSGDSNCDGAVNVGDAVYVINFVFKGGPDPCASCP